MLAPASRAIARSMSGFTELSGKIGLHALAADLLDEPLHVAGGRLRLSRERGDHRPHHLHAVAPREVAERVVRRHDLALRRRHALDARGDLAVEASRSVRMVRSALRANVARPPGSAFVSSARIASTARTPLRRVLPPVRIVVQAPHRVDQAHHLGVPARVVDHVVQPVVDLATGAKHHRRIGHGGHVARPRLVVVRVAARAQHAVDVDRDPRPPGARGRPPRWWSPPPLRRRRIPSRRRRQRRGRRARQVARRAGCARTPS